MMKRFYRVTTALSLLALLEVAAPPFAQAAPFWDLEGHWAQAEIAAGAAEGYVHGLPDGSFRPDLPISRAEFFTLLTGALGLRPRPDLVAAYAPRNWWVEQGYAQAAVAGGLLVPAEYQGWIDSGGSIRRREIVLAAVRALGRESLVGQNRITATDADSYPAWLLDWAAEAAAGGVLKGYDDGSLGLERTATRAEALVMVQRIREQLLMNLAPSAVPAAPEARRHPAPGEPTWTTVRTAPSKPSFWDGSHTYVLHDEVTAYVLVPAPGRAAWLNVVDTQGACRLYRLSGGRVHEVAAGATPIVTLALQDDGRLWFSQGNQLALAGAGGTQRFALAEQVTSAGLDESGVLWAAGPSRLYRVDQGRVASFFLAPGVLTRVRHVAPAPDGSVWLLLRAAQAGGGVEAVRVRSGSIVQRATVVAGEGLQAALLSDRGASRLIYVAAPEPALIRFDLETGAAARLVAPAAVGAAARVLPAPDGGALLLDRAGQFWRVSE